MNKTTDRCDQCSAEALVQVRKGSWHPLLFCGHHFVEHWAALALADWEVVEDQRYTLELAEAGHSMGGDHA